MVKDLDAQAKEAFNALPPTIKAELRRAFAELDTDGSGELSEDEVLEGFIKLGCSVATVRHCFRLVDSNGDHALDFNECFVLFCIMDRSEGCGCDGCSKPIPGGEVSYSCPQCFNRENLMTGKTYELCTSCYSSKAFLKHNHSMQFLKFAVTENVLGGSQAGSAASSNGHLCVVCGDMHDAAADTYFPSSLTTGHLVDYGNGKIICEWCRAGACNKCGKWDVAPLAIQAEKDGWCNGNYYCPPCGKPGNMKDLSSFIQGLRVKANDSSRAHCATCLAKIKNGSLFEPYYSSGASSAAAREKSTASEVVEGMNLGVKAFSAGAQIGTVIATAGCTIM